MALCDGESDRNVPQAQCQTWHVPSGVTSWVLERDAVTATGSGDGHRNGHPRGVAVVVASVELAYMMAYSGDFSPDRMAAALAGTVGIAR
jgi:hypothetical protein